MGYDYWLVTKPSEKCECCGRSDPGLQLEDSGMTWNHNTAFFQLFPDEGFRGTVLYRPLTEVIPDLELVLEWLQNNGNDGDWATDWKLNYKNPDKPETIEIFNEYKKKFEEVTSDGWCSTVGNAYYFINELLEMCKKHVEEYPDAQWEGQ